MRKRGYVVGIASNTFPPTAKIDRKRFKTDKKVDFAIFSNDIGVSKPAAEFYERVHAELRGRGISPEEAVFIDDNPVNGESSGMQWIIFNAQKESAKQLRKHLEERGVRIKKPRPK